MEKSIIILALQTLLEQLTDSNENTPEMREKIERVKKQITLFS